MIVDILVFWISAAIILAIAYLIRYHKVYWLIAGYKEEEVIDPEGLAKEIFKLSLVISSSMFLLPFIMQAVPSKDIVLNTWLVLLILYSAYSIVKANRRYVKKHQKR